MADHYLTVNESKSPIVDIKLNGKSISEELYKNFIGENLANNRTIKKEPKIYIDNKEISVADYQAMFDDHIVPPVSEEQKELKIEITIDGQVVTAEEYCRRYMWRNERLEFEKINDNFAAMRWLLFLIGSFFALIFNS